MALDKDRTANFVGVMLASLRAQVGEAGARAERLGGAVARMTRARQTALAALETSRRRRAARERSLEQANDAIQGGGAGS